MKRHFDSCVGFAGLALLLAGPAFAATTPTPTTPIAKHVDQPTVTISAGKTKTASKTAAKPAAAATPAPDPQPDPVALIAEAHDAAGRGDTELALRMAQSAIVANPALPAAYDALGDVYAASHQGEAARSYYSEALSIDPADAAAQKAIAALDHPGQQAADAEGTKTGNP